MQEVRRRGLKVAVAGIPKTIDNDIPVRAVDNFNYYENCQFAFLYMIYAFLGGSFDINSLFEFR